MIILTIAVMVYYQDMLMKAKNNKPGAESETSDSKSSATEVLTGSSILLDFASDFIDPKAVGYGFLL